MNTTQLDKIVQLHGENQELKYEISTLKKENEFLKLQLIKS